MRLDAEQPEFKYLEQPAGARANDDDFRLDDHGSNRSEATALQARPALESVGVW